MHTLNDFREPIFVSVGNDTGVPVHTVFGSIWLMVGSLRKPGSVNRTNWVYVGMKRRPYLHKTGKARGPRNKVSGGYTLRVERLNILKKVGLAIPKVWFGMRP